MELYNSLLNDTRKLLEGLPVKQWAYKANEAWQDNGASELVLQKEAAYELGATGRGSANYILFTSSKELVPEDKVVLIGSDLREIRDGSDFARIVLLRVGVLDDDTEVVHRTLKDIEFAKYHVYPKGYMVRMSPENYREQVRVSRDAIRRGINFKAIGDRYITEYKKNPNVVAAEVIFVTNPKVDYDELKANAKKASAVTGTLTHILEGLPTDCSVCALKDVCEEVDGMKELHFGIGAEGAKKH